MELRPNLTSQGRKQNNKLVKGVVPESMLNSAVLLHSGIVRVSTHHPPTVPANLPAYMHTQMDVCIYIYVYIYIYIYTSTLQQVQVNKCWSANIDLIFSTLGRVLLALRGQGQDFRGV